MVFAPCGPLSLSANGIGIGQMESNYTRIMEDGEVALEWGGDLTAVFKGDSVRPTV